MLSLLRSGSPDAIEAEALGHRVAACLEARYGSPSVNAAVPVATRLSQMREARLT